MCFELAGCNVEPSQAERDCCFWFQPNQSHDRPLDTRTPRCLDIAPANDANNCRGSSCRYESVRAITCCLPPENDSTACHTSDAPAWMSSGHCPTADELCHTDANKLLFCASSPP